MDTTNQVATRKAKEDRRRLVKQERKNRLVESKNQALLKKVGSENQKLGEPKSDREAQKVKEKALQKQFESQNFSTLSAETLNTFSFAQKI